MATILEDIFNTTKTFWKTSLSSAKWWEIGFPDERDSEAEDSLYPKVAITLYDFDFDTERRIGGYTRIVTPVDSANSDITQLPIPVDYYFQLDTLCKTKIDDWVLAESIKGILGQRYASITLITGGEKLHLIPEEMNPIVGTELGGDIIRSTYRYKVQHWLPDPNAAISVKRVITLHIENNESPILDTVEVTQ